MEPISIILDLGNPLGRMQALHCTMNIVRVLASYLPEAPRLSVALGSTIQTRSNLNEVLGTVVFFDGEWGCSCPGPRNVVCYGTT